MSRFRVLAVACDADRELLQPLVRERPQDLSEFDCERMFQTSALTDEDVSLPSCHGIWIRGRAEEPRWLQQTLSQVPNLLLFFVGPRSKNSREFARVVQQLLTWRQSYAAIDSTVIVIRATELDIDVFSWPRDAQFVNASWVEGQQGEIRHRELSITEDEFGAAVIEARKRIQREPEIGIGALLISGRGTFLLAERLRSPCRGTLGTFGGTLPHLSKPEAALASQAERQFGISDELVVGPLLACTNMVVESGKLGLKSHYVDLTFLAFVREEHAVPTDSLRHKAISVEGRAKYWFSIVEMKKFYMEDRLFAPVANAFHLYCSWAALGQVTSAIGNSHWVSIQQKVPTWVQSRPPEAIKDLLAVAKDTRRNQIWPLFFDNSILLKGSS